MDISSDTFRYLTSALTQVFAAVFFGNCVFLSILHAVVSNHREKHLDAVLGVLNVHACDYIETPGVDDTKRVDYHFPIKRIGIRNSTFSVLAELVRRELTDLKEFIAGDVEMFSEFSRLKLLDTDFGKAIAAHWDFDTIKEENLRFHWERYELCYKTLDHLHLCVVRVLCVPALLVVVFSVLLACTDALFSQGNLSVMTWLAVAATSLGLLHTVYMATWAVKESHRVMVQKEEDAHEDFMKKKREYKARMIQKFKEKAEAYSPANSKKS